MTAIVGIPACARAIKGQIQHITPARYGAALLDVAGCVPVLIPPIGAAALALLGRLDGLLLDGSPSNIAPWRYGVAEDLTPAAHDPARDATVLPLILAALARGLPVFAICRGIQELNVALGGTLSQKVQDLPGRRDHRALEESVEAQYAPRHSVRLSGQLAALIGADEIAVNSVHQQAIDQPAPGLLVEALAPDGTIEGVRVAAAPGFALGVQWHPEWRAGENPASRRLFEAFGAACRSFAST